MMVLVLYTTPLHSGPSALGSINSLLMSIALVFIFLGILIWSNHEKRLNQARRNFQNKWNSDEDGQPRDSSLRYAYMTREELREMVEKEKEQQQPSPEAASDSPGTDSRIPDEKLVAFTRLAAADSTSIAGKPSVRPPQATVSDEATLLAQLALAAGSPGKDKPDLKQPPGDHKPDTVERSMLSNELPEEFKRKSRRI
jgi:hypothetical protein